MVKNIDYESLILTLDVATTTGFCIGDLKGNIIESGIYNCKKSPPEPYDYPYEKTFYFTNFMSFMENLMKKYEGISMLCYEMCQGVTQSSVIHQAELHGVMKLFADGNSLLIRNIPPTTHKKFVTGDGAAKKIDTINAVIAKFGITPIDDNEADAISLYKTLVSITDGLTKDKVKMKRKIKKK